MSMTSSCEEWIKLLLVTIEHSFKNYKTPTKITYFCDFNFSIKFVLLQFRWSTYIEKTSEKIV